VGFAVDPRRLPVDERRGSSLIVPAGFKYRMHSHPFLTVILPARNAEATISSAIASTLNQTYRDFDLWVLENGSSDRTAEIARGFSDPRLKIFELGAVGFQGALQFAIENASSEWLARMDADDLMFPDRLKIQVDMIRQRPDIVLVGTSWAILTPFAHIFERLAGSPSREVNTEILAKGRNFADPSVIFRRRTALEVGGVDSEFTTGDVPLWFRILERGKGWEIAEPLHLYRIHAQSMCHQDNFYVQGVSARAKYAPHYLKNWPQGRQPSDFWYSIAVLELQAGDSDAVRQAARLLDGKGLRRTARRLRWFSYLGKVGSRAYHYRNRNLSRYRHRPEWERLFAPLLEAEQKSSTMQTSLDMIHAAVDR